MADRPKRPEKSLQDRLAEAVEGFLEELAGLVTPEPELIPVRAPVRRPPPPRGRRRR